MIEEERNSELPIQIVPQIVQTTHDHSKERFSQLLNKIEQMIAAVQNNKKLDSFYNIIGLKCQLVVNGLKAILQYFTLLGDQLDKGLIKRHIGQRLIEGVHEYLQIQKFSQLNSKDKAVYILQFQTKFSVCLQFFHTIKQQQPNITNCDQCQYPEVWKDIHFVSVGDGKTLKKKYSFVKKMLTLTTTAIITEQQVQSSFVKKILFGLSYPRYYVDYTTARLKSFIFYKYPTVKLAKQIWNIPELGASKQFIKIAFQNIVINQKIYIPLESGPDQYPDIFVEGKNKVQVRLLNYQEIYFKTKPVSKTKTMCCGVDDEYWSDFKDCETIMIHMHGGGFIALSSRMMQTMTRRWANQLKIPIFSIDYRKPPNDPFPAAPNDCLAVYKFIVEKIHKYMNIKPKNIYLAGDSAGGNLACSLMGSILRQDLPIPKGIYLAYPAVDLRIQFTPSKINAVTDPLLWPSMLLLCLNQYLANKIQNSLNPLASPILLTQEYVGGQKQDKRFPLKWPKTFIVAGKLDPLYDDSLMLMQKLKQSNIQCKCRVYEQLSHGFLSTDFMISECQTTLRDSIIDLKRLIQYQQSPRKKPQSQMSKSTIK